MDFIRYCIFFNNRYHWGDNLGLILQKIISAERIFIKKRNFNLACFLWKEIFTLQKTKEKRQ